jgi:DNA-binding Lrp family transcriptional regulator
MKKVVAFILIKIFGAGSERVKRRIEKEIQGITEVRVVFGEFDVIARAEVSTLEDLGRTVMDGIQKLGENIDTITLISSTE